MLGIKQLSDVALHEWVAQLYATAISDCQEAKEHLAAGSDVLAYVAFLQADNTLTELINTLDVENDGDIAHMLQQYYQDIQRRLQMANQNQDAEEIQKVTALLRQLAAIWQHMGSLEAL